MTEVTAKRPGAEQRADYRPAGTDGRSSLFATVKRDVHRVQ